jgi:hypothetical protein
MTSTTTGMVSVPAAVVIEAAATLDAVQRVASTVGGAGPVGEFEAADTAAALLMTTAFGEIKDNESAWDELAARSANIAAAWLELIADRPIRAGRLLGVGEFEIEELRLSASQKASDDA